jgi:hypothetical protein
MLQRKYQLKIRSQLADVEIVKKLFKNQKYALELFIYRVDQIRSKAETLIHLGN